MTSLTRLLMESLGQWLERRGSSVLEARLRESVQRGDLFVLQRNFFQVEVYSGATDRHFLGPLLIELDFFLVTLHPLSRAVHDAEPVYRTSLSRGSRRAREGDRITINDALVLVLSQHTQSGALWVEFDGFSQFARQLSCGLEEAVYDVQCSMDRSLLRWFVVPHPLPGPPLKPGLGAACKVVGTRSLEMRSLLGSETPRD